MSRHPYLLIITWLTAVAVGQITRPSNAAERCWTEGTAQFFDALHYCVSSELPPQAGSTYEPRNLSRPDDGGRAWCEGVRGDGIGETITLRIERGAPFRRLLIKNGYGKSRETFLANGRLREIEITSDTGIQTRAQVVDQNPIVPVYLPFAAEHKWIRLKILDVYRGSKYSDTCVDFVGPDFEHEEMLLQQRQGSVSDRPGATASVSDQLPSTEAAVPGTCVGSGEIPRSCVRTLPQIGDHGRWSFGGVGA